MVRKTIEQKETINSLEKFYNFGEEVINFFRDDIEILSDANYYSKQNETEGKGLKILTPKQMLQRLPIALVLVKVDTIFMNSENSKTPKPLVLVLKLTNKLDLRIGKKVIALSNLIIYYTWKNIKSSYNNKFKISAPTWNYEFELPDGSYSISDIQDIFEYI